MSLRRVKWFHFSYDEFIFLLLTPLSAFLIYLFYFNFSPIRNDWDEFNSFSHLIKSIVLNYQTFPIHQPWTFGGTDLWSNPQTRIFTPFTLFDIFLHPYYANLLSLIVLAIIGSFGMFKLLTYLKISRSTALLSSFLFIHSSWFSLHFIEGHIPYNSFFLLGWVLYFILNLDRPKYFYYYLFLNSFFLLNGSLYTFVFSQILALAVIALGWENLSFTKILKGLNQSRLNVLLSITSFLFIISPKIIPALSLHYEHVKRTDDYMKMSFKLLAHAFFNPIQYLSLGPKIGPYLMGFHEYGVYLGLLSLLLILLYLYSIKLNWHENSKIFILLLLFFWIGSGFFSSINPYKIIQSIPFLNQVHLQSRYLLLFFLFYLILFSKALDWLKKEKLSKRKFQVLSLILILESLFVSNYPQFDFYSLNNEKKNVSDLLNKLIDSTTIERTLPFAKTFSHTLINKNCSVKDSYDPVKTIGDIKSIDEGSNYKGEIYFLTDKTLPSESREVKLTNYTPSHLEFNYKSNQDEIIELNTNNLFGWNIDHPPTASLVNNPSKLLTLSVLNTKGEWSRVKLSYFPILYKFLILFFFLGNAMMIFLLFKSSKQKS